MLDPSKLPSDKLYKFMAVGGLGLVIAALGFPVYYTHSTKLETITLEEQQAKMIAEFNRWQAMQTMFDAAWITQKRAAADLEEKKSFGPTDPLTGDEKIGLRKELTKVPGGADPENVFQTIDIMRAFWREKPPIDELEKAVQDANLMVEKLKGDRDKLLDLAERGDKAIAVIAANENRLGYLKSSERWLWGFGLLGIVVGATFAFLGFRNWWLAEAPAK